MAKRFWIVLPVAAAVALVSCQAPAVQKSKAKPKAKTTVSAKAPTKPKPKTTVSAKAPTKPKTGATCPQPPPKAKSSSKNPAPSKAAAASKKTPVKAQPANKPAVVKVLPRLVDLGATTCVPCKMMTPILEELTKEYKGRLKVEFIDVRQDPQAAERYGIRVIPTQVFFDRNGEEFFRHEGFYPKEDILRKFKDQGIDLAK